VGQADSLVFAWMQWRVDASAPKGRCDRSCWGRPPRYDCQMPDAQSSTAAVRNSVAIGLNWSRKRPQLSAFRATGIGRRNLPIVIMKPPPSVWFTLRPIRRNILPLFLSAQKCQIQQRESRSDVLNAATIEEIGPIHSHRMKTFRPNSFSTSKSMEKRSSGRE
jgi:hypothetical protein